MIGSPTSEDRDGLKIRVQSVRLRPWAQDSEVPSALTGAVHSAIRSEVARLARHADWRDVDDLTQQALLTALEVDAKGRWRSAEKPVAYMARAVRSRLVDMVRASGCPVKVGVGSGSGGWSAAYAKAKASQTVDVVLCASGEASVSEVALDRARALAELRRVMAEQSPAARAVILDDEKPAEVAKALGLTAKQVYWQTERAREAVRERLLEMVGQHA